MNPVTLSAKGLVYGYRGRGINQPCHFRLETGSLCAMLGGNGVGKSTLLKTILGLHEETEGSEKYLEQIGTTIKGIRKVNGISSFDNISNKIGMYMEHIDFLNEMKHY